MDRNLAKYHINHHSNHSPANASFPHINLKKKRKAIIQELKPVLEKNKEILRIKKEYYDGDKYLLEQTEQEKLDIIKELMKKKNYQNYIGISKFENYIEIPQKYACDNAIEVESEVAKKLMNSNVKLYLCGLGHLKNYLLCQLPSYNKAIYLEPFFFNIFSPKKI